MTAKIDNYFVDYVDFIDVLYETFTTAPERLFEKMINLLINRFHKQTVEIERLTLDLDDVNALPFDDLDAYYETLLDDIENTKLYKKKIKLFIEKDQMFKKLYEQLDKLHTAQVIFMDKLGQLEVRLLKKELILV